jgi:hypothetical protein
MLIQIICKQNYLRFLVALRYSPFPTHSGYQGGGSTRSGGVPATSGPLQRSFSLIVHRRWFHRAARLYGCRADLSAPPRAPFPKWFVPGDLAAGRARRLHRSRGRGGRWTESHFVFWSRVPPVNFQGLGCIPLFLGGLFVILL